VPSRTSLISSVADMLVSLDAGNVTLPSRGRVWIKKVQVERIECRRSSERCPVLAGMDTRLLDSAPAVVRAPPVPDAPHVLTPDALAFVAGLARTFTPRVRELLARRRDRQLAYDAGRRPGFHPDTAQIREGAWTCAPLAPDLVDRRVEITGPPERKMVIHALNSGASAYMADFEDALTPTWQNLVSGQRALMGAVRRTLRWEDGARVLELVPRPATLLVRPRGWHLWERHLLVDGQPVPGALLDAGLYLFHNARELVRQGSGPYLYLPKLEGHLEARLWNDVFVQAQRTLGLPRGTIRATVLIETLPAAFEMHEILYELRDHAAGLNCGRWDYLFSWIKTFAEHPAALVPDRDALTMDQPFLQAYTRLAIETCHARGVHAMGGMAPQIPLKDPDANAAALERVRADKLREVTAGHDGTWVAHPALVPVARAVFDAHMPGPNQIERTMAGGPTASSHASTGGAGRSPRAAWSWHELLVTPTGPRTEAGLRQALDVSLRYLAAWLGGQGCVPLDGRMEDAATAELARSLAWQWAHHRARLDDGRVVDAALVSDLLREIAEDALARLPMDAPEHRTAGAPGGTASAIVQEARALLERLCTAARLPDFLTVPAYERVLTLAQE
jgi:malate synthase